MEDVIDLKTIYTIMHLFGVAIGAGGAYMSDAMYLSAVRDKRLIPTEARFLRLGSAMVWGGIALLIISGALLFSLNPEGYLQSSKFILKMLIVAIIIVNGIVFHFIHMPVLHRTTKAEAMHLSEEFRKKSVLVYVSGAISMVSWSLALILGALRALPITFMQGLLVYVVLLTGAIVGALIHRAHFFKKK